MQPESARKELLVGFHQSEEESIVRAWEADLNQLGLSGVSVAATPPVGPPALGARKAAAPPKAEAAARIAVPKALVEMPAIRAIAGRVPSLEQATTEQVWERIAKLHADEAVLDPASRELIASQNPTATVAARLAITKKRTESPLVRMLRNLEESVALDSVRNEYDLHRKLHRWFVDGTAPADVDALNERVYAELFLTPRSDPWLGLAPGDAYAALPNNGVVSE
jgi:hypothetical protein